MILPVDFDFTQGNLQDYVDCPYRFYLRYILRTNWPALVVGDAQEFELRIQAGARFHRYVQQFLLGISADRISELAQADINPDLHTWWQAFLDHVPPWLTGTRSVETILTATLAGRRLVAKYDLILADDNGQLTIFDWKTAQKAPKKDWLLTRIQTRLYRLVLMKTDARLFNQIAVDPGQISMQYWYAAHPRNPIALPYNQPAYEKDEADLTQLIETICTSDAAAFKRTDDVRQCRFCVYRSHCDRGIEAGDLAEWAINDLEPDALNTEIDFDALPEIEF
jgi:RecB family exonuclease